MAIFVTGDTHGDLDLHKLNAENFPIQRELTPDDYVIIVGDFGLVFDDSKRERHWRNWLNGRNFTTLWIDGNHENFDLLRTFPEEEWNGGLTRVIGPHIRHLARGQVFDINGRRFFTFGGASSHDRDQRTPGRDWWPEELPSYGEMAIAQQTLEKNNWSVDYVLTHCAPTTITQLLCSWYRPDSCTEFLEEIAVRLSFRRWYFGHYHVDRLLNDQYVACYDKIHPVI